MPNLTGGQAVAESLKAQGVDTVFGIISIHNLDLFDALFDRQDSLRFIGGRLELGCGFMADGYARATGKPGVLITSTGPGAADSVGAWAKPTSPALLCFKSPPTWKATSSDRAATPPMRPRTSSDVRGRY